MENLVLATCGAVVVVSHCWNHGLEVLSLLRGLASAVWHDYGGGPDFDRRLEEAVWENRVKQHRTASRACMHLSAICLVGQMLDLYMNPATRSCLPYIICLLAWMVHSVVSGGLVQLNRQRLKALQVVVYVFVALWVYGCPSDSKSAILWSAINTAIRFAVAIFFVDFSTGIPSQSIFSLIETWNSWQRDGQYLPVAFFHQLTVLIFILFAAGLVELNSRSRIAVTLQSESMVSSFRRVLRGVCDGEVLLDSKLKISGKSGCLQTLLMKGGQDFKNKSFEELLVEDERERFRSFMLDVEVPLNSDISAPPCLRVSLKRSGGFRIGVDLFHVPHQLGEETYHLVALREDCDTRSLPEVMGATDLDEHPYARPVEEPKRIPSVCSTVSQVSANSLLQICSDLQEMTLLVDPNSPQFDVEQAHLSFVRQTSDVDSTMPSLRRLVQPTDWGTIRSQLTDFADAARSNREVLNIRLRLQDDCKRCVDVRHVEVSTYLPPQGTAMKLCLQLEALRVVKPSQRHQCELQGVNEGQTEDEEDEDSV